DRHPAHVAASVVELWRICLSLDGDPCGRYTPKTWRTPFNDTAPNAGSWGMPGGSGTSTQGSQVSISSVDVSRRRCVAESRASTYNLLRNSTVANGEPVCNPAGPLPESAHEVPSTVNATALGMPSA